MEMLNDGHPLLEAGPTFENMRTSVRGPIAAGLMTFETDTARHQRGSIHES